jgi:hypothetical protein
MAGDLAAQDDVSTESMDEFVARRRREAAARAGQAAAAYQAYGQAIRAGEALDLSQPSDLAAFGARSSPTTTGPVSAIDNANCSNQQGSTPAPQNFIQAAHEAALQADTVARAAANILTFGAADHLAATTDALFQPGGLSGWGQRYDADLAQEQARNRYDASHRQAAQTIGVGGGTALGLGVMGPMEGALAAVPRLPGAAALTGREAASILGAGGITGLGMQALSDLAKGQHYRSSLGDKLGATVGGVAGAVALPFGPARAGAVGASVTSAAQDLFNSRPVSVEQAGENALAGNLFGGLMGVSGRAWSNNLPFQSKGVLGEVLGDVRSTANGQRRTGTSKSRARIKYSNGKYWYPDGRREDLMFEDKFGVLPPLSDNQKLAQTTLGPNFHLNSFVPADVGKIFGLPAGMMAPEVVDQRRRR